jgi:hypothetical protein
VVAATGAHPPRRLVTTAVTTARGARRAAGSRRRARTRSSAIGVPDARLSATTAASGAPARPTPSARARAKPLHVSREASWTY